MVILKHRGFDCQRRRHQVMHAQLDEQRECTQLHRDADRPDGVKL